MFVLPTAHPCLAFLIPSRRPQVLSLITLSPTDMRLWTPHAS